MQVGDILLVQGKGFISTCIQRVTGSIWSHVAICLGKGYILEIDWNKKSSIVREAYTHNGYEYAVLRHNIPLTLEQKQKIVCAALQFHQTGNRYDWLLILGLLIKSKFPDSKLASLLNEKKHFICTELVDKVLQKGYIHLFPDRNGDIFPYEFFTCKQLHIIESSQKMLG